MENAEEILHFLEEFSKRKPKTIPQELNEYLMYVARTGDPVYQWSLVKSLVKEKLLTVITDFYETTPGIEIPAYPNVDPFNYDIMKNSLLERLDSFNSAPFTIQRICELLTNPRKQYNRVDKFMRAIEKNILVVSTREPGPQRHPEPENGEPAEPIVNGSDNNSEYNVDVEMEDMSWKQNTDQQASEPQPSSSDAHISVDDIEARLKAKQDAPMDTHEKIVAQYESVTPPELNITADEQTAETTMTLTSSQASTTDEKPNKTESDVLSNTPDEPKVDIDIKPGPSAPTLVIPEIIVDDAEMTEQRLNEQSKHEKLEDKSTVEKEIESTESKIIGTQPMAMDESSSDSKDSEPKLNSEVSTSSEESSSSSENMDGNSNSPKTDDRQIDIQEESNQSSQSDQSDKSDNAQEDIAKQTEHISKSPPPNNIEEESSKVSIQSDNYSISDVNSELPQLQTDVAKSEEPFQEKKDIIEKSEDIKTDNAEMVENSET